MVFNKKELKTLLPILIALENGETIVNGLLLII